VVARLPETYQRLLVPEQLTPQAAITWQAIRLTGNDALAVRASRKLRNDDLLVTSLGSTILRKNMDDIPLWRGNHVLIRQLVEDFGRYLYLPRLAGPEVLVQAIRDGMALLTWSTETFAYTEGFDEVTGRYQGLRSGPQVSISMGSSGMLVKPEVARRQMQADESAVVGGGVTGPTSDSGAAGDPGPTGPDVTGGMPGGASTPIFRRFHGTVKLDSTRVGRDASRIADEVISHLAGQVNGEVTVTLEIEALLPDGA
jgi:hypothetical protein